jgi:PAS domain S-box-containing protein
MNQLTSYILIGLSIVIIAGLSFYNIFRRNIERSKHKATNLATDLQIEQFKSDFIINSIEDGVVLIDSQKIIRMFNPAADRMTGWSNTEAESLDYSLVIKLLDSKGKPYEKNKDPFAVVFESHKPLFDSSSSIISRSGLNIAISLSVSPLIKDDELVAIIGVFRDISTEKHKEQERAEFISTASHEMRTPVAAIEGYLSLALNDKVSSVDGRARVYLERAHSSTESLGKLFQDLLTSARAEDGRLISHPIVLELSSFISQVGEDFRFLAQKKGLNLVFVLGSEKDVNGPNVKDNVIPPLYYIYADPERIREVFSNLFGNALKFTNRGNIVFGLTGDPDQVQIYVKDTGIGIPREDIPHLFEKFYRVDNTNTRTVSGTGLGLYICRKIVELYQGKIWVESEAGKGSTIFINLPRLAEQQVTLLKESSVRKPV